MIGNIGKLQYRAHQNHDGPSGRSLHRSKALDKATEAVLWHD